MPTFPLDKAESSCFRLLSVISDRVLGYVPSFPINDNLAALKGEAIGITVYLLEKSTTRTKGDVICRPISLRHGIEDSSHHFLIYTVSLNDTNIRRKKMISLVRMSIPKCLPESIKYLHYNRRRIPTIWANHEGSISIDNRIMEFFPPKILARIEDVIRVTNNGHEAIGV